MKSVRSRVFLKQDADELSASSDNAVGSRARGFELDLRLREFEINQLTQRNNFFMIFQGVLVAGLVQSQGTAAPIITFGMSVLGLLTSVLQIGMAGGAKYWQSRWEASTRSSEIAIVLDLIHAGKLAVQTFTHDSSLLSPSEQKRVQAWNSANPDPDDQIKDDPAYINSVVMADVQAGGKKKVRHVLDWWVRRFAIAPKWSVSRIPIWVAASLFCFWAAMLLNTVHIRGLDTWSWTQRVFELVPLKADSK